MTAYNFTLNVSTKSHTIEVDQAARYGYFENSRTGAGGGLWFDDNGLADYDGVYVLPLSVINALRGGGLVVSADFE